MERVQMSIYDLTNYRILNVSNYIIFQSAAGAPSTTAWPGAKGYEVGAIYVNSTTGAEYKNVGTRAAPVWAGGSSAITIVDPGNGHAIPVTTSGTCALTSAGAETRTLAAPSFLGQEMMICCDTYVGNIVVTCASYIDSAANIDVITFTAARQYIKLNSISVGGVAKWALIENGGCTLSH